MHIIEEYVVLKLLIRIHKKMHLDESDDYQKEVDRKCFEILLQLFQGKSDSRAWDVDWLLAEDGFKFLSLLFGNIL